MELSEIIKKIEKDNAAIESGIVHGNDSYNVLIKDVNTLYATIVDKMTGSYNRAEAEEMVMKTQIEDIDVKFDITDKGIQITLPRNLPKKKTFTDKYDIALFRNSYIQAFKNYFTENPLHFDDKVMIHIHSIYLKESEMLDYDNMAIKQILDIITLFMLTDDNPTRYNLYMSAGIGKVRQTLITIEEL